MLNLLQKYRQRAQQPKLFTKEECLTLFLNRPEHAWMQDKAGVLRCFRTLFERLPRALSTDLVKNPLCFVPSEEFKQQGPARYELRNTVVVFPEFLEMLEQGEGTGVAFLAHEVALVLYELENPRERDPLMAEVEADKFVCDLGLADELEDLLLSMDESTGKRLRLTYLTLSAFGVN